MESKEGELGEIETKYQVDSVGFDEVLSLPTSTVDVIARQRKKKKRTTLAVVSVIVLIVALFSFGLYYLMTYDAPKRPTQPEPAPQIAPSVGTETLAPSEAPTAGPCPDGGNNCLASALGDKLKPGESGDLKVGNTEGEVVLSSGTRLSLSGFTFADTHALEDSHIFVVNQNDFAFISNLVPANSETKGEVAAYVFRDIANSRLFDGANFVEVPKVEGSHAVFMAIGQVEIATHSRSALVVVAPDMSGFMFLGDGSLLETLSKGLVLQ